MNFFSLCYSILLDVNGHNIHSLSLFIFPPTDSEVSHLRVISENAFVVPGDIFIPNSVITFLEIDSAKSSN